MDDFLQEDYAGNIREHAKKLEKAEKDLAKAEADVRKIKALKMVEAEGRGVRAISGQERYADASEELYEARLRVGIAKGFLIAEKTRLSATTTESDIVKTKHVT